MLRLTSTGDLLTVIAYSGVIRPLIPELADH